MIFKEIIIFYEESFLIVLVFAGLICIAFDIIFIEQILSYITLKLYFFLKSPTFFTPNTISLRSNYHSKIYSINITSCL